MVEDKADQSRPVVEHAIGRTLEASCVQYQLWTFEQRSDQFWQGHRANGWWSDDGDGLLTETTRCHGSGVFDFPETGTASSSFSLIQGPTRTTWDVSTTGAFGPSNFYRNCCVQRITDAPSDPAGFVPLFRKTVSEDFRLSHFMPRLEVTPFELLGGLQGGGFELFEPAEESRKPGLYGIRCRKRLFEVFGLFTGRPWHGYLWVNEDQLVSRIQLRSRTSSIRVALAYEDMTGFGDRFLAALPEVQDIDRIVDIGDEVVMPAHSYEIAPDVLGPLDVTDPAEPGVHPDFHVVVEGRPSELGLIAEALNRADPRIMALTAFGREATEADIDLLDEFNMLGPNWVSEPRPTELGFSLYTDWKGEALPDAASACLAIVVQELLTGGVIQASVRRAERS